MPDVPVARSAKSGHVAREGSRMATGRVLQFDPGRGYGFVAADDGGEDVFLHASVFDGDPDGLVPGTAVEFQVMAGDRGRKAFAAHFTGTGIPTPADAGIPTPADAGIPTPTKVASAQRTAAPEDEQMCDVLSATEFVAELTELLLSTVPTLTGQQILEVRQSMLETARKHGWVDE
jgi:cold shock protein